MDEFSSEFIKALLKTSYYTPEHPSSKKAREGLFEKLGRVNEGKSVLTFSREVEEKDKDVFVGGIFDGEVSLTDVMGAEKGKLYVPKLWDFMSRKRLISLSIKPLIEYEEFIKFLDLLAEAPQQAYTEEDSRRITMIFVEKGISNVLPVFEEDILGRERKLHWLVRIALSRLRKDLKLLPLYRHLSEEKISEIKKQVFREIVSPLKRVDVLTQFLEHSDLIKADVKLKDEKEIEREVVENLPAEILIPLTRSILHRLEEIKGKEGIGVMEANLIISLAFLCQRLIRRGSREDIETLAGVYRRGFLEFDALPQEVKNFISLQNEMVEFLSSRKLARELFVEVERKKYTEKLSILRGLFGELIRMNKEALAMEIVEVLDAIRTHETISWKKELAESLLSEMKTSDEILALLSGLLAEGKEVEKVIRVFELFGENGIPYLLEVLKTSPHRLVRRKVIDLLIKNKEYAVSHVRECLERGEGEWYFIRNLIYLLREMKYMKDEHLVKKFLYYLHPRVREEAIEYLFLSKDRELVDEAEKLLSDGEERIRKRMLLILSAWKVKKKEPVLKAISMLHDEKESSEVKAAALQFFSSAGNLKLPDGSTLEDTVISLFEKKKKFPFFRKEELNAEVKRAAVRTLGEIGTVKSLDLLRRLQKEEDSEEVRTAMKKILERISQRKGA